jgi:choline monooxygenase
MTALDPRALAIDADVAKAHTLPAAWYVRPESEALERDRVFARTWQYAIGAAAVEAPGSYATVEVAGRPIVVVRDEARTLRAFYNVCRHRAGPVATGAGACKALKCAYHGWTYGLDGALKFTPEAKDIACFDKGDFGLVPVAVDAFGPFVFVRLSIDGPSLAEFLGEIVPETQALPLGRMRFYTRRVYEIACNWKVYVDNYLEGYHIPQVHPGLFQELSYPEYKVEVQRFHSKQHAPVRKPQGSLYTRGLDDGAAPVALYYWVFPNLMLNVYPDNVQVNVILPLGSGRTATVFDWYVLTPDDPRAAEDFAASLAFSDVIQKEDIGICEHVQKGLASGAYDTGRFAPQKETGVHHFHSLMVEFLQSSSRGGAP